jgi:hypothetical protein
MIAFIMLIEYGEWIKLLSHLTYLNKFYARTFNLVLMLLEKCVLHLLVYSPARVIA